MLVSFKSLLIVVVAVSAACSVSLVSCDSSAESNDGATRAVQIKLERERQLELLRASMDTGDIQRVLAALKVIAEYNTELQQQQQQQQETSQLDKWSGTKQDEVDTAQGGGGNFPAPTFDTQFAAQLVLVLLGPLVRILSRVPLLGALVSLVNRLLEVVAQGGSIETFVESLG